MSDTRTRREKLSAMAKQERQSPNEAAIARRMLLAVEPDQVLNPMLRPARRKPKTKFVRIRIDEYGDSYWDDDD